MTEPGGSDFFMPLTRKSVNEMFLTRDELLSMVPVERLLRAHVAENQLKPVSVLEGGLVRLNIRGRTELRRIVGNKERGSHLELVLDGLPKTVRMEFASSTNPFASDEAFAQTGKAELASFEARLLPASPGLPLKQAAKHAWRVKVRKRWGAKFNETLALKSADSLYRDLCNPIPISQMLLHLVDIPMQLQRNGSGGSGSQPYPMHSTEPAAQPSNQKVTKPKVPADPGPSSLAVQQQVQPVTGTPAASAPTDPAAAVAASAAAAAVLPAPRDPRLKPPRQNAAQPEQGMCQLGDSQAGTVAPSTAAAPSGLGSCGADAAAAEGPEARVEEAAAAWVYSPVKPIEIKREPDQAEAEVGTVKAEGKAEQRTGPAAHPSLSDRAVQLFRSCMKARLEGRERGTGAYVVRLSQLAVEMRRSGDGWTAASCEGRSFKEVIQQLLDQEALGAKAGLLRYSKLVNDWELVLSSVAISRIELKWSAEARWQQEDGGRGEAAAGVTAALQPDPAPEGGNNGPAAEGEAHVGVKREQIVRETATAEPPRKQQRVCRFYQRGRCKFGALCWDLHADT